MSSADVPTDNSYVTKNEAIPVQKDEALVEDGIDEATADSDAQLARDDQDAIDESNIIDTRTRGAAPTGSYKEPGDNEGIP